MFLIRHTDGSTTSHHGLPNDGTAIFAIDTHGVRAFLREGTGFEAPWVEVKHPSEVKPVTDMREHVAEGTNLTVMTVDENSPNRVLLVGEDGSTSWVVFESPDESSNENLKLAIRGELTEKEASAWDSAVASSEGNGHDFGFTDEVVTDLANEGIGAKAAGALISQLVQKGLIEVHDEVTTDSGTWTQLTLTDKGFAALNLTPVS